MKQALGAAVAAVGVVIGVGLPQALAAGPQIAVSRTSGLRAAGESVDVTGSGFDVEKGVYVAFCVDRGPTVRPTPCGGGADTEGTGGASVWVSSDPPPYGRGLAVPYGPGGTFRVSLRLGPVIGEHDCRKVRCLVTTRADHTRTDDRSQDARVPVTFAGGGGSPVPKAAAVGLVATLVGATGATLTMRRRQLA